MDITALHAILARVHFDNPSLRYSTEKSNANKYAIIELYYDELSTHMKSIFASVNKEYQLP